MESDFLFLRMVLGWVIAGHILTGLIALGSGKEGIRFGQSLYGALFEPTDQFQYIIRPLGAYMLGMAYLQYLAFQDPIRYTAVIDATLIVLGIRLIQRLFLGREIFAAFGIPPGRHWTTTTIFFITAALLLAARLHLPPCSIPRGLI